MTSPCTAANALCIAPNVHKMLVLLLSLPGNTQEGAAGVEDGLLQPKAGYRVLDVDTVLKLTLRHVRLAPFRLGVGVLGVFLQQLNGLLLIATQTSAEPTLIPQISNSME
eukprot:TRINITY_DN10878_c0_g1_i3.p2 TRINITY_DN10878_c0_g1~~TRINITY_DN10878_c0_g1_i3.p2  ORF type:complete len:110 (+),score=9.86 TRINITY_DN10878_c0_g1_i3:383-712(+)